jgi:hypothetical protein
MERANRFRVHFSVLFLGRLRRQLYLSVPIWIKSGVLTVIPPDAPSSAETLTRDRSVRITGKIGPVDAYTLLDARLIHFNPPSPASSSPSPTVRSLPANQADGRVRLA